MKAKRNPSQLTAGQVIDRRHTLRTLRAKRRQTLLAEYDLETQEMLLRLLDRCDADAKSAVARFEQPDHDPEVEA